LGVQREDLERVMKESGQKKEKRSMNEEKNDERMKPD
jgi:hypothetical protein